MEVLEDVTAGKPSEAETILKQVDQARQSYAVELRFTARVLSPAVINAFAAVPRKQFVGPGPWRISTRNRPFRNSC